MTAAELRDIFLAKLVRECGGSRRRWRIVIGEVKLYSLATHAHCNWAVSPSGSVREVEEAERVADDLRQRFPIVTG